MTRLNSIMTVAALAGLAPHRRADCHASDDLLAALGDGGFDFDAPSSRGSVSGWEEADGLAGLEALMGMVEGDEDDLELGRKVKRAARRAGTTPNSMFGAMQRALQRARGGGGGAYPPAALPATPEAAFQSSVAPGTPARGQRMSWMPFPAGSFINGGPTTSVLRTTSQRPLRTIRIVTDQARQGAANILLTITEVKIGQEVQPAATGAVAFGAFQPNANGIWVNLDPIDVNVPVEVTVAASAAPGVGDRIDFTVSFFGYSIK
jgi:hypothetical protein